MSTPTPPRSRPGRPAWWTLPSLALSLLLLLAPAAHAQEKTFEGKADVTEVQVPVNVIDRDGNPVRGLTVDDFEIFDEGERQTVSDLDVVDLDVLQPTGSQTDEELAESIPSVARRHFLLLFDLSFSSPAAVIKARRAAQRFVLEELHPTDLAAVAVYTADLGPRLVVTFTPDRAQLARALDTLGAPRLVGRRAGLDPLRFLVEDPSRAGSTSFGQVLDDSTTRERDQLKIGSEESVQAYLQVIGNEMDKAEKHYERGRVSTWISSLGDMAKMLANVGGRKNVVLFSEGFDGRLMLGRGPDAFDPKAQLDRLAISSGAHWFVDTDDIYGNTALQNYVTRMMAEFRRADCVIQAVDISGLGSDSAEQRRAKTTGQDALFYMANETGGTLFEDANNFDDQLAQVLQRSNVTYVLTFSPEHLKPDGSYHRLQVKLRSGAAPHGVDIAHRDGYYAPRPFGDLHPMEKALIAADSIAAGAEKKDIRLDVLAAPFRANEDLAYVPVIVEIDGADLLRGQEDEKDKLSAEIYAYVSDMKGEMEDFFTQVVNLSLSAEGRQAVSNTGIKYYGHMSLPPGDHLVRVLVRNARTGRTGVESVRVKVPEYEQAAPQLLPPFFLEPRGRWVLVRESSDSGGQTVVYPFTVNGAPYIPAAKPVMQAGDERELCLVAYNLGKGQVELESTVVGDDGQEVQGADLSLVERTVTGIGGLDKLLARFRVNDLKSGTYTLKVALRQPESGIAQVNSIPFSVPN